jgi:adenosylmethionine-8-amino-7-oxononanoate aminotransferase
MANLLKSIKMDSVEIWGPVTPVMEKKADYYYFNLYLPYGKLLYTMPPFNITDDELSTITNAIKSVI